MQFAQPVPHVPYPTNEQEVDEKTHDADNFVPKSDRTQTMEANVTEVFEIGSAEGGEDKVEGEGLKESSSSPPTESVGPQPTRPTDPAVQASNASSARSRSHPLFLPGHR